MIDRDRLRPHVFRLPVEKIRAGYKSDIYFARTKLILDRAGYPHVRIVASGGDALAGAAETARS